MNPARGWPDRLRNVLEESDNVVIRPLLDFGDLGNRESRALANRLRIGFRDLAEFRHGLAGEDFDLEPNLEFPLLGPKLAHGSAGITIDHRTNIESKADAGKAIRPEKGASLERVNRRSDALLPGLAKNLLADPRPAESSVILHPHL